jgi:DNA polymerase-3 subunit gamma/tau
MEQIQANAKRLAEWPEILQLLRDYSQSIAAAFAGSTAYVSGDYVLIEAKDMAFELLRKSSQRSKMRDAIQQVTGRIYKLGPYKDKAEAEEKTDPLAELAGLARDAGIEVINK